jgi:hypothetical protein
MATLPPAHIDTPARTPRIQNQLSSNETETEAKLKFATPNRLSKSAEFYSRTGKGRGLKKNESSFSGVKRRGRHLPWRTRIEEKQWATRQKAATKIGKGLPPPVRLLPTEQW